MRGSAHDWTTSITPCRSLHLPTSALPCRKKDVCEHRGAAPLVSQNFTCRFAEYGGGIFFFFVFYKFYGVFRVVRLHNCHVPRHNSGERRSFSVIYNAVWISRSLFKNLSTTLSKLGKLLFQMAENVQQIRHQSSPLSYFQTDSIWVRRIEGIIKSRWFKNLWISCRYHRSQKSDTLSYGGMN